MRITILLPNYNNELYLNECLVSIQKQTYSDFNVLIIDDGSTDNSLNIIKSYKDSRFQLIENKTNSGIISTLNKGLEIIESEYIIRMDGDDKMHPTRVEKLVSYMDKNPSIGVCGSAIQHFGISDDLILYESDTTKNNSNLLFGHTIGHASVIYRTEVLKKHNIKYTDGYQYIEDYKIFYDLSKVTLLTSIPDVLYYYRREEYNNFKNVDIKKIGYLKIYHSILKALEIQVSETTLNLHYECFHNCKLYSNYQFYVKHLDLLLNQNKKLNIYDSITLLELINTIKNSLFFKACDQKKIIPLKNLKTLLFSPKKMYYYIKTL